MNKSNENLITLRKERENATSDMEPNKVMNVDSLAILQARWDQNLTKFIVISFKSTFKEPYNSIKSWSTLSKVT